MSDDLLSASPSNPANAAAGPASAASGCAVHDVLGWLASGLTDALLVNQLRLYWSPLPPEDAARRDAERVRLKADEAPARRRGQRKDRNLPAGEESAR